MPEVRMRFNGNYRHFAPKTLRTLDTSALVWWIRTVRTDWHWCRSVVLKTVRTSVPNCLAPSAELSVQVPLPRRKMPPVCTYLHLILHKSTWLPGPARTHCGNLALPRSRSWIKGEGRGRAREGRWNDAITWLSDFLATPMCNPKGLLFFSSRTVGARKSSAIWLTWVYMGKGHWHTFSDKCCVCGCTGDE